MRYNPSKFDDVDVIDNSGLKNLKNKYDGRVADWEF